LLRAGISKAYGGALSALSITYTLTPVLSSFDVASPLSLSAETAQHTFRGSVFPADQPRSTTEAYPDSPSSDVQGKTEADAEQGKDARLNVEPGKKGKGKGTGKWVEREEVVAVYPDRRVQLVVDEKQVEGDFW
jgi:hypothetical protein